MKEPCIRKKKKTSVLMGFADRDFQRIKIQKGRYTELKAVGGLFRQIDVGWLHQKDFKMS